MSNKMTFKVRWNDIAHTNGWLDTPLFHAKVYTETDSTLKVFQLIDGKYQELPIIEVQDSDDDTCYVTVEPINEFDAWIDNRILEDANVEARENAYNNLLDKIGTKAYSKWRMGKLMFEKELEMIKEPCSASYQVNISFDHSKDIADEELIRFIQKRLEITLNKAKKEWLNSYSITKV